MTRNYCSRCLMSFGPRSPGSCSRRGCGRTRPPTGWPSFLPLGSMVDDRWLVEEILGMGGAGITYACIDTESGEQVALKYLHTDRKSGVLAHRLAIEGEVLELLNHPNIVPFRALSVGGTGECYLATAYMPGGSLEASIRREGPLGPRAVLAVGRQLALALQYVHAGGIVHRDLKPGNVLLEVADREAPVVRLADFGIARIFRSARAELGITRTGAFIGTPEYAAPEQIRGEKGVGPAADAFALGALLHYVASGKQLLSRRAIEDWEAFRAREWDPADRPRLTSLAENDDDVEFLGLLDRVIDSLMSASPAARLDLADAAIALGAIHDELSPEDAAPLHPPTLVSIHEGWSEHDEPSVEALVPDEESATVVEALPNLAETRKVAVAPGRETRKVASPSPSLAETARVTPVFAAPPLPPSPVDLSRTSLTSLSPAMERPIEEVDWTPRSVRRRRAAVRFSLAALVLLGGMAVGSGSLAAWLGPDRVAALPGPVRAVVDRGTLPVDLDALDALDDAPVLTASTESIEDALAAPLPEPEFTRVLETRVPKRKGLPAPPRIAPPKRPVAKPIAKKLVQPKTTKRRGKVYSSPTRTAAPIPAPERAVPDDMGLDGETRVERLSDDEFARIRHDGATLAGRIESEHRDADELAQERAREAEEDAARAARVQRRIDRVLAEVEASRARAAAARRLSMGSAHASSESCER